MKNIIITFILTITFSIISFGQDTLKFYYKSNGKETKKKAKAEYLKEVIRNNDKILMRKVLIETGKTIQVSELKSWSPYIENGLSVYYDSSSDLYRAKGYYKNGNLDSIWIYRNLDNSYDTVNYSGIDPNKKFSFNKETFLIVEQMPLICCDNDLSGEREIIDKKLTQLPDSGQINVYREKYMDLQKQVLEINRIAFDRFKIKNLKYPLRAQEDGKKGIVYAKFIIDENGKTDEIEILKGIDKDLDTETIRLIKTLPICITGELLLRTWQ